MNTSSSPIPYAACRGSIILKSTIADTIIGDPWRSGTEEPCNVKDWIAILTSFKLLQQTDGLQWHPDSLWISLGFPNVSYIIALPGSTMKKQRGIYIGNNSEKKRFRINTPNPSQQSRSSI